MNIALFLFHPTQFFRKIRDGQLGIYIMCVIAIYSATYVIWTSVTGSIPGRLSSHLLFDNRILHALISLLIDFGMSITLSIVIHVLAKKFTLHSRFTTVLLSILSLEIISTLIICIQLSIFYVSSQVASSYLWIFAGSLWQMGFLFIAVKTIFETSNMKAALIQLVGLVILVPLTYALVLTKNRLTPNSIVQQGIEHMARLDFQKAIESFDIAIQRAPSNAKYYFYLGEAYRKSFMVGSHDTIDGDRSAKLYEKAEDAYKKSLTLDSRLSDARMELGLLYCLDKQKYEKALEQFHIIIERDPDNKRANREIGRLYLRLNKPQMAKKYFLLGIDTEEENVATKTEFRFSKRDKIWLQGNKYMTIKSDITWRIADPILFEGAIGTGEIAESRIGDIYHAILYKVMSGYDCDEAVSHMGNNTATIIIDEFNRSRLAKNFGIEISQLEFKKED